MPTPRSGAVSAAELKHELDDRYRNDPDTGQALIVRKGNVGPGVKNWSASNGQSRCPRSVVGDLSRIRCRITSDDRDDHSLIKRMTRSLEKWM